MSDDRMDGLLEQVLATGEMPASATAQEREEIEPLLGPVRLLEAARGVTDLEAEAAFAAARARFRRHVAANQAVSQTWMDAISRPRFLPWGRVVPRSVTVALAGSAAAVVLVAFAAVLLWQTTLGEPQSAYAYALQPGDYVQLEGVVGSTSAAGDVVTLQSELGTFDVEVTESTSRTGREPAEAPLQAGDAVVVGGVARTRTSIAASTVVRGKAATSSPRVVSLKQLDELRPGLAGRVVTLSVGSDGGQAVVVIDTGGGKALLVRVDGASAERLLARTATVLGQRVAVLAASHTSAGTFSLEVPNASDVPQPERSSFVGVRGTVLSVDVRTSGVKDRVLALVTIQTARGEATVIVRPGTLVFPGESGLQRGAGIRGEAVGYTLTVSGSIDKTTGHLVADVIVMGPKAP